MRRLTRLILAHIRVNVYLIFCGMWKGECQFTQWVNGKTTIIATGTGPLLKDGKPRSAYNRVFFQETI